MDSLEDFNARLRQHALLVAGAAQAPALTQQVQDRAPPAAEAVPPSAVTQQVQDPSAAGTEAVAAVTQQVQDERPMAMLTDEIRTFIVKSLACFETPSRVADAVRENFQIEVSRQRVFCYDPKSSQRLAPRWRALHAATRQAYLREVAEIDIAQKSYRLAMLDRLAHNALSSNHLTDAAKFLEQAAKECGGFYENRRPVVLQLPAEPSAAPPLHQAAASAAAETCRTISAAATIISIGSEGAALSPLSGPFGSRNSAATCSEA